MLSLDVERELNNLKWISKASHELKGVILNLAWCIKI